ncbi:MAG: DNA cytosine methyltransferase, partial [Senegalia sp. (in: firmicutes)]
ITLREIIVPEEEVPEKYYIEGDKLEKFKYLRGAKRIERTSAAGHQYIYSEGGMSETDDLDLPGRTMLTSEGTVNRSTHLLKIDNRYRLITPKEAERLQDFPDDWTRYKQLENGEVVEVSDRMRMFFMGNALVTGIVKRIGD